MYKKLIFTFFLSFISVWTVHAQRQAPATPEKIIQKLTHQDYKVALDGLNDYMRLSEDQRSSDVKSALVQALKNENERARSVIMQKGEYLPIYTSEGEGEGVLSLVKEVYKLKDPATIPVLLPWCQTGDDMVDFGRQAFEPLLRFLEEPPSGMTSFQIGSAMYTLRMMVDSWDVTTFSESERQRMRQIAEKYIKGSGYIKVRNAISLAYSLKEESLLQMASGLINDDTEMVKRQISNIDRLRQIISEALAGTLVERQYVPYEERKKEMNRF